MLKGVKRKTASGSKRLSIRRRKGGVNNNNEFIKRRTNLINDIQNIMNSIEGRIGTANVDEMTFVDEIRDFEPKADIIDAHFGNNDMEDMLNQDIEGVMIIFGLIHQNNNTILGNNNNVITVYNKNKNKS